MRRFHQEADDICTYVTERNLSVATCNADGVGTPSVGSVDTIEEMLTTTSSLWGTSLPYYLSVSKTAGAEGVKLANAVIAVEAQTSADEFLIVAYQDGGLISVSGVELPFQAGARDAVWWSPPTQGRLMRWLGGNKK